MRDRTLAIVEYMQYQMCSICKKNKKNLVSWSSLEEPLQDTYHRKFSESDFENIEICSQCVSDLRIDYIEHFLELDKNELSKSEQEILEAYKNKDLVAKNSELEYQNSLTFGDKISNMVSKFGGSWYFIIFFSFVVIVWMIINTGFLMKKVFDPYPFILLNLLLSCIAALQAPIILMSQNRLSERDRIQAENDYMTNLRAELEIQLINAKLDQLIKNQWTRLLKVQEMQIKLMKKLNSKD